MNNFYLPSAKKELEEEDVSAMISHRNRNFTDNGVVRRGNWQSKNFITGRSGWRLSANSAEFYTAIFNIGGTVITIDNTQDIQENLDLIKSEGGGILYLQSGTYTLTANISIPSGVALQGVSRDNVIIDCNSFYEVKAVGSDAYTTGTATISNGDTEVVGSGTTWTSAMVGRFIQLDRIWYSITAFTDTTHITIGAEYQNDSLSGANYTIATINTNAILRTLTVTNALGSGIFMQYAMEPRLDDLIIYGCGVGIDLQQVVYPRMLVTSVENGTNLNMEDVGGFYIDFCLFANSTTGAGVVMTDSGDATFFNSSISSNTGNGLTIEGCNRIEFSSITVNQNGGKGVEFIANNDHNQLANMIIDANTSDGVKLTASTDSIVLSGITVSNNGGYGVNIAASTCDNNILVGVTAESNSSGSLNDSGTGTLKSTAVNIIP